jgi:PTH1 family peptidyl-tRNA hydrolase
MARSRAPRIVVGLGNPGPEYDWTPHNLGFHAVERLAREGGSIFESATRSPPGGYVGPLDFRWARLDEPPALLVEPATYMNLSGTVVAPIVRSSGIEPCELLVVYDDMDLPLGARRIRPHGGTGGHRGMESIVNELGTDRFPRLRIGIGRPRTDAARHVLAKLAGADLRIAEASVEEAAGALRDWLDCGDIEGCMTRYHSRWNQMAAEQAADTEKEEEAE